MYARRNWVQGLHMCHSWSLHHLSFAILPTIVFVVVINLKILTKLHFITAVKWGGGLGLGFAWLVWRNNQYFDCRKIWKPFFFHWFFQIDLCLCRNQFWYHMLQLNNCHGTTITRLRMRLIWQSASQLRSKLQTTKTVLLKLGRQFKHKPPHPCFRISMLWAMQYPGNNLLLKKHPLPTQSLSST